MDQKVQEAAAPAPASTTEALLDSGVVGGHDSRVLIPLYISYNLWQCYDNVNYESEMNPSNLPLSLNENVLCRMKILL